jgi:hypothetical protein
LVFAEQLQAHRDLGITLIHHATIRRASLAKDTPRIAKGDLIGLRSTGHDGPPAGTNWRRRIADAATPEPCSRLAIVKEETGNARIEGQIVQADAQGIVGHFCVPIIKHVKVDAVEIVFRQPTKRGVKAQSGICRGLTSGGSGAGFGGAGVVGGAAEIGGTARSSGSGMMGALLRAAGFTGVGAVMR